MPINHSESWFPRGFPQEFTTTHWSVVLSAGEVSSADATQALEHLCRTYWYPLYAFVRRQGRDAADAQDLTQSFFAHFLGKNYLRLADPQRGRFRTFLLSSLKHFLVGEWEKTRTLKRGGAHSILSWDEQTAEGRYIGEPIDDLTPDMIYQKRWAVTLLEKVLSQLSEELNASGKGLLFEALKPYLWGDAALEGYTAIASRLGLSEGALRQSTLRLRERFRESLRAEVACTVASPAEIDEELQQLIATLRS